MVFGSVLHHPVGLLKLVTPWPSALPDAMMFGKPVDATHDS